MSDIKQVPQHDFKDLKFEMGHQEVIRVLLELERYADDFPEGFMIPVAAAEQWLWVQLGYGDEDELEDAIKMSVEDFIRRHPQFIIEGEGEAAKFKSVPHVPETTNPRKLTLLITDSKDLFTILQRGRDTKLEIPEIEFEMGAPEGKEVDTLYNYIGGAVFQLGQYIKNVQLGDDTFDKIYATMQILNGMLDVEVPFHIVAHDPNGQVNFRPNDRVVVEYIDEHKIVSIPEESEEQMHD